jgi:hypothetical protein
MPVQPPVFVMMQHHTPAQPRVQNQRGKAGQHDQQRDDSTPAPFEVREPERCFAMPPTHGLPHGSMSAVRGPCLA